MIVLGQSKRFLPIQICVEQKEKLYDAILYSYMNNIHSIPSIMNDHSENKKLESYIFLRDLKYYKFENQLINSYNFCFIRKANNSNNYYEEKALLNPILINQNQGYTFISNKHPFNNVINKKNDLPFFISVIKKNHLKINHILNYIINYNGYHIDKSYVISEKIDLYNLFFSRYIYDQYLHF